MEEVLKRAGYQEVVTTTDSRAVPSLVRALDPDLLLLDLHMPGLDGFQVMAEIAPDSTTEPYLPILVLTADFRDESKDRALASGAKDFLNKPFRPAEALLRIGNLLETRFLYQRLQNSNQLLEERVQERTRELEVARIEMVERLTQAAEFRDDATGRHTHRVAELSGWLAAALGLPRSDVERIRTAAPLHDAGKIAVPDAILLKPGPLTPEEMAVMQTHTTIGAQILSGGRSVEMMAAEQIALSHHERWDGSGYPQGLQGTAIPLDARIVAVADFYDALTSDRPYRPAWSREQAMEEIRRGAGSHFDPEMAQAFLQLPLDWETAG